MVPGVPAEPVQPSSRGFGWLSVRAPRDLGPGQRNREGVLRSTDHARGHFVPMLLFPGDKHALEWEFLSVDTSLLPEALWGDKSSRPSSLSLPQKERYSFLGLSMV